MSTPTLWLQLSAGRCPAECEWVVGQLAPRLSAELQARGLQVEEIDRTPGSHAGDARSVLLRVSGADAQVRVADWLGTIQWIGTSPYRPHHKRKNWFVSIAAFQEPAAETWRADELRIETLRASGPGGQHVNRTESTPSLSVAMRCAYSEASSGNSRSEPSWACASSLSREAIGGFAAEPVASASRLSPCRTETR